MTTRITSSPRSLLLLTDASTSTAEFYSATFTLHPKATQWSLVISSDQNGTADVDWLDLDGGSHEIDAGQAVVGSTPKVLTYFNNLGTIRVRYTPGAQPHTTRIEAFYSGHSDN